MHHSQALVTAVSAGDVAGLARCFQDAELMELVAETERSFAMGVRVPTENWFSYKHCTAPSTWKVRSLFMTAVLQGHVEVLQWLFAPERVALMPLTLAHVWLETARAAFDTTNAEALELLLTVGASSLLPVDSQKWMVDVVLTSESEPSAEMIRLVLAHGGGSHTSHALLHHCVASGSHEALDCAVAEGAFVVGASLDYGYGFKGKTTLASEVLKLGMDPGPRGLVNAAQQRRLDVVEVLTKEGFVDTNTGERGLTPLIAVASINPVEFPELLRVARALLNAGADVNQRTASGETALHRAMRSKSSGDRASANVPMVELLLQFGADPNVADRYHVAALDWLPLHLLGVNDEVADCLELLLRHGADPYAKPSGRESVATKLTQFPAGQVFRKAHTTYFPV